MKVQHIGHAGFIVEVHGYRLVIDPWFNSAFLESWFPWPPNSRFAGKAYGADALYISHAHEDHFDRRFLRDMPDKAIPVVIPAFRSRYLEREVRKLGFTNVIPLGHWESYFPARDLGVIMLIDQSHKEDSALLVEDGNGFQFLDSNDCELAISDWPQDIDLLACAFSGAFWYPHCYDFTDEEKKAKAAEVRQNNFQRLVRRVKRTGAKAYLPSAGPAVFLDPALEHFNYPGGIYPTFDEIEDRFRKECPGVRVERSQRAPVDAASFTHYQADEYFEWAAFYDRDSNAATAQEVSAHFTRLQRRNRRYLGEYARDIRLASDGREWRIPLGLLRGELEEAPEPHFALGASAHVLRAVLDGQASWETALLSNRVRLHCDDPGGYDATLMGLLNFGDRPVQTLAMARQQESRELVTVAGRTFQRWCPHAREDLAFATVMPASGLRTGDATIKDGVIECPRHNWRWDAATGACLSGQGIPLHVEEG